MEEQNNKISNKLILFHSFEDYQFLTRTIHPFFALMWIENEKNANSTFTLQVRFNQLNLRNKIIWAYVCAVIRITWYFYSLTKTSFATEAPYNVPFNVRKCAYTTRPFVQ